MGDESVHNPVPSTRTSSIGRTVIGIGIISSVLTSVVLIVIMRNFDSMFTAMIAAVILLLLSNAALIWSVYRITSPICQIKQSIQRMAVDCDFTTPVPYFKTNDEIQDLSDALKQLQAVQMCHMSELVRILTGLSQNRLDLEIHCGYPGDFQIQKQAIFITLENLNRSIEQMRFSSENVSTAANRLAAGVQVVAEGSRIQSEAIENLGQYLEQTHKKMIESGKNAEKSSEIAMDAGREMVKGMDKLGELMKAMEDITQASQKISRVIKTVDDIAFQTNILALNASVEAARAGAAGKGFAVVAQEVRNLATKSAEASQGTSGLIENAIASIKEGTRIAQETTDVIQMVMEQAKESTGLTMDIAGGLVEVEEDFKQIEVDMQSIRHAIQENAKAAHEGAAAGDELISQTQQMSTLVDEYILKRK